MMKSSYGWLFEKNAKVTQGHTFYPLTVDVVEQNQLVPVLACIIDFISRQDALLHMPGL